MSDTELLALSKRLAVTFANRLAAAKHIVDELAQEAALGILKAAENYRGDKGTKFTTYANPWAWEYMKRHMNRMGGPVNGTVHSKMADAVSLISPDAPENTAGMRDDRPARALQHEHAEWAEALSQTDARTAMMVEAKLTGATNEEIAASMGLSREYVRKRVLAFAEGVMG